MDMLIYHHRPARQGPSRHCKPWAADLYFWTKRNAKSRKWMLSELRASNNSVKTCMAVVFAYGLSYTQQNFLWDCD
jgi:hypothetical protein